METVGFIGLGNMGAGMAANVQKAGYPFVVYDVREETTREFVKKGARLAASPGEMARLCDVIITSLPGPKQVEEVALGPKGVLQGIKQGSLFIDTSTSRPSLIRKIDAEFQKKGARAIDAAVSGGKTGAANRNLAIMVGADKAVYERAKPVLDAFGDKVTYCGDVGAGTICKLVHNMIAVAVGQLIAEGLTLGVKAGVEPIALWEAVRRGAVGRMQPLHQRLPETVFRGKFEPAGFALALAKKDFELATELGREFKVPLLLSSVAEQGMIEALNRNWGDKDWWSVFLLQEERAGVQVRAEGIDSLKSAKLVQFNPDAK